MFMMAKEFEQTLLRCACMDFIDNHVKLIIKAISRVSWLLAGVVPQLRH